LHIDAMIAYRWLKRRNLIGPMISGRRQYGEASADASITSSRLGLALLLTVQCAGALSIAV